MFPYICDFQIIVYLYKLKAYSQNDTLPPSIYACMQTLRYYHYHFAFEHVYCLHAYELSVWCIGVYVIIIIIICKV